MKQIFNNSELTGKTIAGSVLSEEEFWIKFTDNSFVVFDIEDRTEGFGHTKNAIVVSDWRKDKTSKELVTLGIITEHEYKEALKIEEQESEKRQAEYKLQEQKRIEEMERKQYEELSKKFGK